MDKKMFQLNPRAYALCLVEDGYQTADNLLLCCLNYMSCDDVRDMLDCNELSPRFDDDDLEEAGDEETDKITVA